MHERALAGILHIGHPASGGFGQNPAVRGKSDLPLARFIHMHRQAAGPQNRLFLSHLNLARRRGLGLKRNPGIAIRRPREMLNANVDDVIRRRAQPDREERPAQRIAPVVDAPGGRVNEERAMLLDDIVRLRRVGRRNARLHQPFAVAEFHFKKGREGGLFKQAATLNLMGGARCLNAPGPLGLQG